MRALVPCILLFVAAFGVPLCAMTACTKAVPAPPGASSASASDATAADAADPGPSPEQCRALYDRAQVEARAAWDRASKACAKDDDCVLASKRGCLSDCSGFPIARGSLDEWKKAYATVEASTCKAYRDGDCMTKAPMAIPSCPAYRAVCKQGACVTTHGGVTPPGARPTGKP